MKKIIISLIILLVIILSITFLQFSLTESSIPITAKVILNNQTFTLEIAQTFKEKQQGLMYRKELPENQGMIFVYNYESPKSFWMKNTLIPLDLIFINSSDYITDIKENFQPCIKNPCETYSSNPAQNIIEINAGLVDELELEIGDKIYLDFQ